MGGVRLRGSQCQVFLATPTCPGDLETALSATEIDALPDNYARAASTGKLPTVYSPEHPEIAFLPRDLKDQNGPWVQLGEAGLGPVAPFHVQMLSGRSSFLVFINCPGGRAATLAYLES